MSMLSAFLVSQRSWFPGMQSHAWFLLVHAGHSKSTTHSCRASVITIRVISPIMNSFFIFKCIQFNNVIRVAPVMASVLRLFPDLIDQISFVAINLSKQLKNTFTSRSTELNTLFLTVWVFTCAYPHRHTHVHIKISWMLQSLSLHMIQMFFFVNSLLLQEEVSLMRVEDVLSYGYNKAPLE